MPSVERLFEVGLSELRRQRYTFALDAFTEAMELEPNLPEIYYNLGITAGHLFRWPDAEEYFRLALKTYLHPNPDCHVHLALIQLRGRRWEEARESLERALELNGSDEVARVHLEDLDRYLEGETTDSSGTGPSLCEGWYDERLDEYRDTDPDIVDKKERVTLREFIFEAMGRPDPSERECDGTHDLVEEWALRQGRDPLGVSRFLFERGLRCDCEVLDEGRSSSKPLVMPELPGAAGLSGS